MVSESKNGKLQIVIKSYTVIERSSTVFQISDSTSDGSTTTTLDNLHIFDNYDRVNVSVAVLQVKDSEVVGESQLSKQEITVADETTTTTLVLWGNRIGSLEEHKSYLLKRVQVSCFAGKYQLQYPRSGASVEEIDPLDTEGVEDSLPSPIPQQTLIAAKVIGVQNFEVQYTCISCKATMEKTGSSSHGICHKCNTGQVLMGSRLTAKLILQDASGTRVTVRAYTATIKVICNNDSEEVTMMKLLTAPRSYCSHSQMNVHVGFSGL